MGIRERRPTCHSNSRSPYRSRWRLTRRTRPRTPGRSRVFWDTVLAVNELHEHGEAHVYDLTVPGTVTPSVGAGGPAVAATRTP